MTVRSVGRITTWATLKDLDVIIEQRKILHKISLNLNVGENILILGPNGSGKTTFLKLLNRSIYPIISKQSSLKIFNKENINIWDLRKRIGFLFKEMEDRVKNGVTTYQLIASGFNGTFGAKSPETISKKDNKQIIDLLIDLDLEIVANKFFNSLSDGQKRRALIARALVYKPKLLVLDEPFSNLDIKSNYILNRYLIKLMNESVNVIYVTHSLESIIHKTNRVILIKEGKVINDGSPEKIMTSKIISKLFNIEINVIKEGSYWRGVPINN